MTITIGNGVTSIGERAFYSGRFTSVTIPDSVTSIGRDAFGFCDMLTSVTIGNGVTSIGDAFSYCGSLKYNEYDNGLYLGNGSNPYVVLIKAKSTDITSCVINEGCKVVADSAFNRCESLTNIVIPDGLTAIGDSAFSGCSGLQEIHFNGIKSQWEAISKGGYWNFNVPSSCKVICSDGEISL